MLAEKKSLKRFLLVYILSTMFLIAVGEWFYYKSALNSIIKNNISDIQKELSEFLQNKRFMMIIKQRVPFKINDTKYAVFVNGEFMYGDFNKNINEPFLVKDNKLYYKKILFKRWGKIEIIFEKNIKKEVENIKKELLVFAVFAFLFVCIIAFILGKIFLRPMKDVINNLESFIRDTTHEMNTPISVILSNIEILKMKNAPTKELKRIENAAFRLSKIFKDLTFVRLHHQQKRDIVKVDLAEFIQNRLVMFETQIENKNIKIIKNLNNETIEIDKEDLTRLIDNILSNAIKYSNNNGEIYINLKNGLFSVLNEGEIKNLKEITKKFVRENSSEGGFGLGLFIVKEICKRYGFKFEIKNQENFVKVSINFKTE